MSLLYLMVSFVLSGLSGDFSKALVELRVPGGTETYVVVAQFTALMLGLRTLIRTGGTVARQDISIGVLMGLLSGFIWLLFMSVLAETPGVVAFPVRSIGGLILTAAISMVAWKERISRCQWAAMVLAITAIWLMF